MLEVIWDVTICEQVPFVAEVAMQQCNGVKM